MKKLSLLLAFVLCVFITVSAQSEERSKGITTKNGTQILPVAGDFAIGVDATPFLDYAGKLLSESGSDAPTFGFGNDGITIYGKYFLAPDRAIRAKLLLDLASTTTHSVAQEIGTSGPVADKYVDNIFKNGRTEIRLNGGYEFRRGYGRLQGFYGAEVGLAYLSTSQSNEYGNALSSNNPLSNRLKESTSGGKFTFSLGGFAGVEYFVAPKISIGAEVGLQLAFSNVPKGEETRESWDTNKVTEKTIPQYTGGNGSNYFSTRTATAGNLFLLFHF